MYESDHGRALHVTLPEKTSVERQSTIHMHMFFGGLGSNAKMLYDNVGPGVDPFSAENTVFLSPGALTGTGAPTACRTEVTTKSPLKGIVGTGNLGGAWGQPLKQAGYDSIVIRNRSSKPVYLVVDDDDVQIRDAMHLWERTPGRQRRY
jgi:aldehyde:ferredoxin oxidoreductase